MNDSYSPDHQASPSTDVLNETDPVCGMMVDPLTAHHVEHAGQTYHFCSAGCRTKFIAHPAAFLGDRPPEETEATPGAIWTCPMHPQIRQERPGTCPICGMALEPEEPSLDDAPNPELIDFTRRFWIATALTVPLLAVSMFAEIFRYRVVSPTSSPWVQLALAAPVVMWAGAPFFVRGWRSLVTRHLNMFTLISLGVAVWAAAGAPRVPITASAARKLKVFMAYLRYSALWSSPRSGHSEEAR